MGPRQVLPALVMAVCWMVAGTMVPAVHGQRHPPGDNSAEPMSVKYKNLKWSPIFPELGLESPRITILRVDSRTGATQLMIRVPKTFHVPLHWHSANETHTVLNGDFIVKCAGQTDVLGARDFNYVPKKMPHEAWTKGEGALLLITVDGAWDVNWVNGPPTRADMLGGRKKVREEEE